MNYYPHNIGDYAAATRGLSLLEHGAYRSLLDLYYLEEEPLPANPRVLCRLVAARSEEEQAAVRVIAGEYFREQDGLLHHKRCDEELAKYRSNVERCRVNGMKGGRSRMFEDGVPRETKPTAKPRLTQAKGKQEPGTSKQETENTFSGSASNAKAPATASQRRVKKDAADPQAGAPARNTTPDHPPASATPPQGGGGEQEEERRLTYLAEGFGVSARVRAWAQRKGHDRLEQRLEYFTNYAVRRAARYADWDAAFICSIEQDWARLNPPPEAPIAILREGDLM